MDNWMCVCVLVYEWWMPGILIVTGDKKSGKTRGGVGLLTESWSSICLQMVAESVVVGMIIQESLRGNRCEPITHWLEEKQWIIRVKEGDPLEQIKKS